MQNERIRKSKILSEFIYSKIKYMFPKSEREKAVKLFCLTYHKLYAYNVTE